jgi:1,4-alpha-glucan branching enzyme
MVKKKEKPKRRRVSFSLEAPKAREVILVGDFNDWSLKKHAMTKNSNGLWTKAVMAPPGQYEYKFLVDGEWWTDPGNDQTCTNTYGTTNSIVSVR